MVAPDVHYGEGVHALLPLKCWWLIVYCLWGIPPFVGEHSPNKWYIVACAEEDVGVIIDCVPKSTRSSKGMLVCRTDRPSSHSNPYCGVTMLFPIIKSTSISGIINLLVAKGRHRFKFGPKGRGHRQWVLTALADLSTEGFLQAGDWDQIHESLLSAHYSQHSETPVELVHGSFYAPDEPDSETEA